MVTRPQRAVLLMVTAIAVGCRATPQESARGEGRDESRAAAAGAVPIERRLGWVNGSCFAIANPSLLAGSPIIVVGAAGSPAAVVDAFVAKETASSDICPALLPDRRASNAAQGWSFYELRFASGGRVDLGIGIAGGGKRIDTGVDVTGDGVPESFTQCSTSEGVKFAVWHTAPYQGMPLWSAYYYLGYDTDVTCPA